MTDYFKEIFYGLKSLLIGMGITIRYCFSPVVTVQYPHETLKMPARFKGHIELIPDEQTGTSKCIACGMCQRTCPSGCISVDGEKPEGAKTKMMTSFMLDYTKCSLCGLCVESCTFSAIRHSMRYNLAGTSKQAYIIDLKKRLEESKK
ncbi:MAG TPA: NADH-quinone oxidoreductase subunit I [Deltaproteobacteria bacterium]|nr:NADH-quinone oxidoreductase subunit I [Deltaproteobacteria bacterium]HQB39773.1 NADH-quinone oxidoreductase subunit I [Deltaproteobacteria bacterium]